MLFMALCTASLFAQSPGGVSSPEVWFKSVAQTKDLGGNYVWKDFSGDSVRLRLYDTRGPLYGNEYATTRSLIRTYNFNPAMDLSEVYASKQFLINKTNLSQSTIISVWGPNNGDFNQDMFLYALNGRAGYGYIFTKDKFIHSNESGWGIFDYESAYGKDLLYQTTDTEPTVNKFRERALRVATYTRALQPNTSVWGEKDKAIITIGEIFHPSYSANTSTFSTSKLNNRAFYGYTPEFIIYNRLLTPLERRMAETYLAVKYGLTLDMSYISSRGTLLWDLAANKGYNTRVTGYGCDNLSGMYQKIATTSYEEAPYYSDAPDIYDAFDLNNSYNLPCRYRLLVIGRQPASPITDDKYVLFGDNDASITASSETGVNGIKLMPRRWLLTTNMSPVAGQEKQPVWNTQGLDVYTEGFVTKATKTGSSTNTSGWLVTSVPLLQQDGYFSWTITSTRRGPLTVKFGTDNPQLTSGSHDYGYYINQSGLVYKIVKGQQQTTAIATVYINQKIEVSKVGNTVCLRSNGTRLYSYDIEIDTADASKAFYGSIRIDKYNQEDIVLSDLRHGGFCDTGNRVELSYITYRASDFHAYRNTGKSYLVIDRSGTGDFSSGNVEYIPCDELDESRYKVIFNNVFWDSDGNGKDVFTFGYKQSNLIAVVKAQNTTCKETVAQQDGEIKVNIKQGFKGFSYSLVNKTTKVEQKGTFFQDSLRLKNLAAGTYDLSITEIGGFNLYPKQDGSYVNRAISSSYFTTTSNAWMEWTVTGNTQASVGMKTFSSLQSNPATATVGYGFYVNNGKLYSISKGVVATTELATVTTGDRIRVLRSASKISCQVNASEVYSTDIASQDLLAYNYAVAEVPAGNIYNLKWNGISTTATWVVTDNIALESSAGDGIQQTLTLTTNCGTIPIVKTAEDDGNSKLAVSSVKGTNTVDATLSLEQEDVATFIAFDVSGRFIAKFEATAPQLTQTAKLRVGHSGIYLIKAITTVNGEYTKKILVQ